MKMDSAEADLLDMPVVDAFSSNWPNGCDFSGADMRHFLMGDDSKLTLSGDTDDEDHKPNLDELEFLLADTSSHAQPQNNNNLAELKPLPPFTGYTGHLSINGISGLHYHSIAAAPNSPRTQLTLEPNNNSADIANQNNIPYYPTDHVVSSTSTMDTTIEGIKNYNINSDIDDDFASLIGIGSSIADTTMAPDDGDSKDSWLDLEAWISSACSTSPPTVAPLPPLLPISVSVTPINNGNGNHHNNGNGHHASNNNHHQNMNGTIHHHPNSNNNVINHIKDNNPQFVVTATNRIPPNYNHHHQNNHQQPQTFPHMPLLQNRLQNGPPKNTDVMTYNMVVTECTSPSSSTQYIIPHSPPCHVVSTSDLGFMPHSSRPSPDMSGSYPHTTTPHTSKKPRSRAKTKSNNVASISVVQYSDGCIGKEKTMHRCSICNRGFLNKSNIKVHLRTHTGEKPFRCEICGKAFRQKAHLLKHTSIHKRSGRD